MMKHNKTFDWLEKAREEIYEIIKEMTIEEEVAYWKQQDEEFRKYKEELLAQAERQRKAS